MPPVSVRIPSWADPQNASVLDNWWERAARTLGGLAGAADPTSQAMAIGAPVELPGGAGGPGQRLLGKAIKAYHGSPHDFDQFSLGKIGTGEGGQAYGYGLYFAENPAVAVEYRKMGDVVPAIGGKPAVSGHELIAHDILSRSSSLEEALRMADEVAAPQGLDPRPIKQVIEDSFGKPVGTVHKGATYEVNLHASPDELLDWDKPLSQQSPKVQEAIKKQYPALFQHSYYSERLTNPEFSSEQAGRVRGVPADAMTGEHFYQFQVRQAGGRTPGHTEGIASQKLKDAGIKGIQYLDQGSRAAGQGTKNFVIFDDKIIEIAKKYGVALPVAASIYKYQQAQQK